MNTPQYIFFDLETSDLEPIGQILNFAFVVTDASYTPVDEFCGRIRISRLQLPRARAIATNRIDVLVHQQETRMTEPEFCRHLTTFIYGLLKESKGRILYLVGFNSNEFDLPFLRTTLIRNGFNPFWKVRPKDVLQLCQMHLLRSENFRQRLKSILSATDEHVRLKLEWIAKAHGLLDLPQTHESKDDVLLTIEVLKCLEREYGTQLSDFTPYEGTPLIVPGKVYRLVDRHLKGEPALVHGTLHSIEGKSVLWVILEQYLWTKAQGESPKKALKWFNNETKLCLLEGEEGDLELRAVAEEALQELSGVTLRDIFPPSICDIEQDIYKLPWEGRENLLKVFQGELPSSALQGEALTLYERSVLAWGESYDPETFARYAKYRYGGSLILKKNLPQVYHPTISMLLHEIEEEENAQDEKGKELMVSLRKFYQSSSVWNAVSSLLEERVSENLL